MAVLLLLAAVVSAGLAAVNPAAAPAATGAGTLDGSFGTGGRTVLDWNDPQPATLVGASGAYVAAAVGDRFGLGRFDEYGRPTIGADGTVTVGFGKPATARGIVDDALVVGNAGDDFGLVHFGPDGQADLRFGSAGRLTIGFGGPAVAWAGVRTWDSYGWVLVGSARTGSTSQAALARIDLYGNLVGGFGAGGKVLADFGPGDDEARSVATDNAKNLIVAGRSGDAAVVARYTPSGALDPAFGTGGVVRLDLSPGEDVAQRILFDPNGYVVVAGTAGNRGFVAQLGDDGRLDPTFGKGGVSLVNFGGTSSRVADLSRLNGRTVVAGTTTGAEGTAAAAARLTDSGGLDPSFGTGGVARADLGGSADEVNGVLLRYQDGTVQVAGGNGGRAVLWGLTAAGAADTRLGDGGRTQLPFGQPSPALSQDAVVQPDGRIVVSATVGSALGLARLTADGRPDPTFGHGGYVLADLGNAGPAALALAPDGDIVVWGSRPCGDACGFLARFQPDGAVDAGFGTGGAVLVYGAPGRRTSLLVQPDGAIVAVGTAGYGTTEDSPTFLGRWTADGRPDPTFGTGGVATTTRNLGRGVVRTDSGTLVVLSYAGPFCCAKLSAYDAAGQAQNTPAGSTASPFAGEFLALTPDGGFVVAGETQPAQTQHTAEVFRFDATGRMVAGFGTSGMVTLTPDRSGTTLPEDIEVLADGRILVAVSHFPQNADPVRDALVLLTPDGSPDPTFGTGGVATLPGILTAPLGLAVQSPDRLIMVTTERPGDLATTVVQAFTLAGAAPSSPTTAPSAPPPAPAPTTPPTPPTTRAVPAPPTCFGRPATIVGTAGDDHFTAPSGQGPAVIAGLGGNDTFDQGYTTKPREVYFCGGSGNDTVTGIVARFDGGTGKDALDSWKCARPAKLKSVERKKLSSRCPTP